MTLDASGSSQFVSALLMAGARLPGGLDPRHVGPPVPSRPHIEMTVAMLRERRVSDRRLRARPLGGCARADRARDATVEPDLSNAAAFLAAAAITGGAVTVPHWPGSTEQPGDAIRDILTRFGAEASSTTGLTVRGTDHLHGIDLDLSDGQRTDAGGRRGRALADDTVTSARHRPHPRPRDRPAGRAGRRARTRSAATSTRPTTG